MRLRNLLIKVEIPLMLPNLLMGGDGQQVRLEI